MSKLHALTLFAAAGLMLGADDPKKVPETIQGTWLLTEVNNQGKTEKPPAEESTKFVITADKLTPIRNGKEGDVVTYKIDTSKKPITIDITTKKGDKTEEVRGIVEVDGDTMKMCFAKEGTNAERPTDFMPKEGSMHSCATFKREKK